MRLVFFVDCESGSVAFLDVRDNSGSEAGGHWPVARRLWSVMLGSSVVSGDVEVCVGRSSLISWPLAPGHWPLIGWILCEERGIVLVLR
jgi:hypothetical protein